MDVTSCPTVFRIKEDFEISMNELQIGKKAQIRCKVNNEIVSQAVSFISEKDHIIATSWGDREFNLSQSEKNILSGISRKISPLMLWNKNTSI